jgi:F-type H+-transporting ATPase subunit O
MLSNLSIHARRAIVAMPSSSSSASLRSIATDSAHRPPLDLYGLTARYANATYIAASKSSTLDKVESELLSIKATSEKSAEFKSFLDNPLIPRDVKAKKVEDLLSGKTTSVTLNLMTTLAGNARLSSIGSITDDYVKLMKAKRGEVEATIISAEPLSKAQNAAVSDAMASQFPSGAKVVLKTKVDPSILGGLQIQIGDKFLDLSVASRIEEVGRTAV